MLILAAATFDASDAGAFCLGLQYCRIDFGRGGLLPFQRALQLFQPSASQDSYLRGEGYCSPCIPSWFVLASGLTALMQIHKS